jgi:hypothetical protein
MVHSQSIQFIYLHIYGAFNDDVSSSEHRVPKTGQSVKNNFKKTWKEAAMAQFEYNFGNVCKD